jgi:hypothetical protein
MWHTRKSSTVWHRQKFATLSLNGEFAPAPAERSRGPQGHNDLGFTASISASNEGFTEFVTASPSNFPLLFSLCKITVPIFLAIYWRKSKIPIRCMLCQ